MTIYILGTPEDTAEELDDKSLDKMIKDIALVLLDTHLMTNNRSLIQNWENEVFLKEAIKIDNGIFSRKIKKELKEWSQWARACVANYEYLVELGLACCHEYDWRFNEPNDEDLIPKNQHKMTKVILWARDNVPILATHYSYASNHFEIDCDTPDYRIKEHTPFPLVIPKKYIIRIPKYKDVEAFGMIFEKKIANEVDVIESYRNYYQAKLSQHLKKYKHYDFLNWTRRCKPQCLLEI